MDRKIYMGLSPYSEKESGIFKGRSEETDALFSQVIRNDYTVCYAESGEGKTSLLKAGLFPKLRANMFFPVEIVFKQEDMESLPSSFDELLDKCITESIKAYKIEHEGAEVEEQPSFLVEDFGESAHRDELVKKLQNHSWWKLRNMKIKVMGFELTPVLVFDQFEEVFNLPKDVAWTKKFFEWLEGISTDVCPDIVIKDVRDIIGENEAFPKINTSKRFKAIFSLRKESVGDLDYWGIQRNFIPDLKSNRYCLKPLTYQGAEQVMLQKFERTDAEKVLNALVSFNAKKETGSKAAPLEYVGGSEKDLPVIPALLLSVICDWMEESKKSSTGNDILNKLATATEGDAKEVVTDVLEAFYNKKIAEAGIQKGIVEQIEEMLIDANGNRIRVSEHSSAMSAIDFSKKYKEKLKKARLIKVFPVSGTDYVELAHDSLCEVVKRHVEEVAIKKNSLSAALGHLPMIVIIAILLWSIFTNKELFFDYVNGQWKMSLAFLGSLLPVPLIIDSATRRLRLTPIFSIIALLIHLPLAYFFIPGHEGLSETLCIAISVITIGVPLIALGYSFYAGLWGKITMSDFKTLYNSWPLWSFLMLLSGYIFYLCVFNDAFDTPEPFNSSWGVLVIPFAVFQILRIHFKVKHSWWIMLWLGLLGAISYNSYMVNFSGGYPLGYWLLGLVLGSAIAAYYTTFRGLPMDKRLSSLFIMAFVSGVVILLNHGYWPNKVAYQSVNSSLKIQ